MQESDREEIQRLVQQELQAHGFTDDATEDQRTMHWLRDFQKAYESAGNKVWGSVIVALATGVVVAVWEGFKVITKQN